MDSTNLSIEQIVATQQEQIRQLQELLANNSYSAVPSTESSSAPAALYSFGVRPSYTWIPTSDLSDYLHLDASLFTSTALSDDERKSIVERYPAMEHVTYQPPDMIPDAARKMQRTQQK